MGRHKNIEYFYLSQTQSHIPKNLICDNAHFIIMFKQDNFNMRHIYQDQTFVKVCQKCWEDKDGLLLISKDNEMDNGKHRRGFDQLVTI